MNLYSIIFIGLISGLSLVALAYFFLAIYNNFKAGQSYRQELAKRIEKLRLNKMLEKKQIKLNRYIHELPVHQIENQIRNCETCIEAIFCDQIFSHDNVLTTNHSFCPNIKTLNNLARTDQQKSIPANK